MDMSYDVNECVYIYIYIERERYEIACKPHSRNNQMTTMLVVMQ